MANIALRLFEYKEDDHLSNLRTIDIDGEIWFVANDVANLLGYVRPSKAITDNCNVKGVLIQDLDLGSGIQQTKLINEGNVYRLILKSKLPSASKFESWLVDEVIPSIRKKGYYGKIDRRELPNFIERYKNNYHKIPNDFFSVISELFITLYSALEKVGYTIPNTAEDGKQIMPDISVGRMFSDFIKKNYPEYSSKRMTYEHEFPDGKKIEAFMYPIDVLPMFRRFVFEIRIPDNADKYFKQRDPLALNYIPKVLGLK